MKKNAYLAASEKRWAIQWLDAVAAGSITMSQRKMSSVERLGGGIDEVRVLARKRGVHLLQFMDDKGDELVAASKAEFKVIC